MHLPRSPNQSLFLASRLLYKRRPKSTTIASLESRFMRRNHPIRPEIKPNAQGIPDTCYDGPRLWVIHDSQIPFHCSESYVTFAFGNSTDGIVHEPPTKWLGVLLPPNSMVIPPVPNLFWRIQGLETAHTYAGTTMEERRSM